MYWPCRFFSSTLFLLLAFSSLAIAQPLPEPWADAEDQPARVDFSASVGLFAPTDWSDLVLLGSISPATGALEQVLVRDVRVEPDTHFAGAVTYWRGRYGVRVQGGLSQSSLTVGGPAVTTAETLRLNVDTWTYDVRGVVGLVEYSPRRWVWPYAFFGFGGITYDLERSLSPSLMTFIERGPATAATVDTIVVERGRRNFLLAVDELGTESVFAVNLGIGTDLRIPLGGAGIGLRLELSDQMAPSPVGLRIGELRRSRPLAADTGVQFAPVHHLRVGAGIVLQVGR
jgi:hypothetical protein